MAQGSRSKLEIFEEFLFADIDALEAAIADAAVERIGQVTVGGINTALTIAATVDEPGGVLSMDVTDDAADDGAAVYSAPMKASDGNVSLEVRVKTNDISGTNYFCGWMESLTADDPDQGLPFTISGTTISVVNLGVTAFVFNDQNGTNSDWHFAAAQDATMASGVDATDPPVGGGRAGVDLSTATGDDEYIVFRVEVEVDGTAFGYVGSSHNDETDGGFKLIGQTARGALDPDALIYPVLMVTNNAATGVTAEIDYWHVTGSRDWTV